VTLDRIQWTLTQRILPLKKCYRHPKNTGIIAVLKNVYSVTQIREMLKLWHGFHCRETILKVRKLSSCLTNQALRHEGVCGNGCIDPRFLDLGTSWRSVVSFTLQPFYPRGKSTLAPILKETGWAPEPVWTTWRRENSWPHRDSNSDPSVVRPVASRCALPAPILETYYFYIALIMQIVSDILNFLECMLDFLNVNEYSMIKWICS
jgi:hypothetical protein